MNCPCFKKYKCKTCNFKTYYKYHLLFKHNLKMNKIKYGKFKIKKSEATKTNKVTNLDMGTKQSKTAKVDLNLHGYPPINFRKIKKSGFRIGAHVDIGMKDFEAGMTFGQNNIHEIQFSENNHLKLLKSLENEESTKNTPKEKDKIINTLMDKLAIKYTNVKPSSSESTN